MTKATKKSGKSTKREVPKVESSGDEIRGAVREHYGNLAKTGSSCCSTKESSCGCGGLYSQTEILSLPQDAIAVSAGCGNPTAIASLKPGMVVVDLGSGGGIDAFLSARKVGPKGLVYGIDMTPEMIHRARKTARETGIENVEFRLGEIEHIPLDAGVADVVISNCVINLSPDKQQVFKEAFRVLKPGGRLAVSDIVLISELPEDIRENLTAWSSCVSGAVSEKEYVGAMKNAGFEQIKVEDRVVYTHEQLSDYLKSYEYADRPELRGRNLSELIASYRITAVRPRK